MLKKSADQPKVIKEGPFQGLCASVREREQLESFRKDYDSARSFIRNSLSIVNNTTEAERDSVIDALKPSIKIAIKTSVETLDRLNQLVNSLTFRPILNELKTAGLVD